MISKVAHGEKLNFVTHAIGTCFAVVGFFFLIGLAVSKQDNWRLVSFSVYALTTIGLYLVSAIYHGTQGEKKVFFRKLDYIGIYLKIAGAYTPYAILALGGTVGWTILAFVWTLALFGVYWEAFVPQKNRRVSFTLYAVMAITVLPALKKLMDSLPTPGFALVMLGFLAYGIGCYFFINDEKIKHGHGLWHLFVMVGTACQFLCVLLYLT